MKTWAGFAILMILMAGNQLFAAEAPVSALQSMHRLIEKLERGDISSAKELALDHAGFMSISKRKKTRKEYDETLDGFLRGVSRELTSGVALRQARCADVLFLPAGTKTKRDTVMVVVHATFQIDDKPAQGGPMTFLFIQHGGGWKFFLRK